MKTYNQLSKEYYTEMYIDYVAYELYLDRLFHQKQKNTNAQIFKSCFDSWVFSDDEKEKIMQKAQKVFETKYQNKS